MLVNYSRKNTQELAPRVCTYYVVRRISYWNPPAKYEVALKWLPVGLILASRMDLHGLCRGASHSVGG